MGTRPLSRVVETRHGRYDVATIPLPHCPIPGFRASLVQAVSADRPTRAIRLTLYERLDPPAGETPRAA